MIARIDRHRIGVGPSDERRTVDGGDSATIALYRKAFFDALPFGNPDGIKAPLAPMLRAAMDNKQVCAELYAGAWTDVGTPERLAELNRT